MTDIAINRLADLIQEVGGGRAAKGLIDIYPKKVLPKKIDLKLEKIWSLLGIKIPKKKIVNILKSLEFEVKEAAGEKLVVKIPTWRPDLKRPEDLIEEVGRIYGYTKIDSIFPKLALIPPQRNEQIFWENKIKSILKEFGFTEVYNYSFISKTAGGFLKEKLVELENPFSEQFYYLRPNLLINLLANISHNSKYLKKEKELEIFELGTVFRKKGKRIEEKRMLAGMLTGTKEDFYILKGAVDGLLEGLGISDKFYDDFQATSDDSQQIFWNPKKSAEIKISRQEVGFLGELSSKTLSKLGNKEPVTAFEIDFEKLIKFCSEEQEYQEISKFPSAVRDVAVLVPFNVKVVDILNKINVAGGELVRDIDLFDIYEGKELSKGKKNLAFHIIFQAKDRTLSGREINSLLQKIISLLEKEPSWEVRR